MARTAAVGFAAASIFLLGWGIGNGRIVLWEHGNKTQNQQLPATLDYGSVDDAYKALKTNFDGKLDADKLTDGMKQGLAKASGDPYTEYFSADEYKEFSEELNGSFTGIGAELSKDKNNNIVIVSPIAGFPAEKAGLKPKDVIVEVDGKSAYDLTVSEAVKRIRGPKDTHVKLKVVRGSEPKDFDIVRATINIPSVESKVEDGVGYMKISRFGDDTVRLATEAAQSFKQQNVEGVVLDLRGDPGGLLDAAVSVSSLWLPEGKTVLSERRGGVVVRTYKARGASPLAGIPTSVLINAGSASASEITAGALKDNGVATLYGEKSFGKGSVQQLANLKDGTMLKVTIARWYTPGGKNIDKEGISPDKEIKLTEDDATNQRDPQKDAATAAVNK